MEQQTKIIMAIVVLVIMATSVFAIYLNNRDDCAKYEMTKVVDTTKNRVICVDVPNEIVYGEEINFTVHDRIPNPVKQPKIVTFPNDDNKTTEVCADITAEVEKVTFLNYTLEFGEIESLIYETEACTEWR